MHVFLTGATGFIGHHILQELLDRGHTVRCLLRKGSEQKLPVPESKTATVDSSKDTVVAGQAPARRDPRAPVEIVFGDVTDIESIEGDLTGCDAVIHLVGLIDEDRHKGILFENVHVRGTRNVVEQARAAGIQRFVHMSANGARPDPDASRYHTTKFEAEQIVRSAGFEQAVIFRPTIIFGDPGEGRPEFARRIARTLVGPYPVLPIFGDGRYRLQPVHISVVARAFVDAVSEDLDGAVEPFCVGGPDRLTYVEMLDRIARGMGLKPKPKIHLPMGMSRAVVNSVGKLGLIPITPPQFQMLIEGNTCTDDRFGEIFRPEHLPFEPDHLTHLRK